MFDSSFVRTALGLALLLAAHPGPAAPAAETFAQQYRALLEEFEQTGGARPFAPRFLALAQEHQQDAAAAKALLWVVKHVRGRSVTDRALQELREHHTRRAQLDSACLDIANARSVHAEPLLRAIMQNHPQPDVQAQACYYLASLLEAEANILDQLQAQPELRPRVLQYYGQDYGSHLATLQPQALERKREAVYQRMLDRFGEAQVQDVPLSAVARRMLFRIRHLSVGKPAPEIEGEDIFGNTFKLSDYRGKIVMLTFWGHW